MASVKLAMGAIQKKLPTFFILENVRGARRADYFLLSGLSCLSFGATKLRLTVTAFCRERLRRVLL